MAHKTKSAYQQVQEVTLAEIAALLVKHSAILAEKDAALRALTERLDLEVDEFNAGFAAQRAGTPYEHEPPGIQYDEWRTGWVWGAFEGLRKAAAEAEATCAGQMNRLKAEHAREIDSWKAAYEVYATEARRDLRRQKRIGLALLAVGIILGLVGGFLCGAVLAWLAR